MRRCWRRHCCWWRRHCRRWRRRKHCWRGGPQLDSREARRQRILILDLTTPTLNLPEGRLGGRRGLQTAMRFTLGRCIVCTAGLRSCSGCRHRCLSLRMAKYRTCLNALVRLPLRLRLRLLRSRQSCELDDGLTAKVCHCKTKEIRLKKKRKEIRKIKDVDVCCNEKQTFELTDCGHCLIAVNRVAPSGLRLGWARLGVACGRWRARLALGRLAPLALPPGELALSGRAVWPSCGRLGWAWLGWAGLGWVGRASNIKRSESGYNLTVTVRGVQWKIYVVQIAENSVDEIFEQNLEKREKQFVKIVHSVYPVKLQL